MKEILDVYRQLQDEEFVDNQFLEIHWNKNVLFVNPQLNGRHFYKYITPYILMYEFDAWATALTSMEKYKPTKEYELFNVKLNSKKILWADFIVIPFTYSDMSEVYKNLKNINPNIRIVFNVDFNYYELSKKHPLHSLFTSEESIDNIENSIFYSDITIVTNAKLCDFISNKFKNELNENKYKGIESNVSISGLPLFVHEELIMENIEVDFQPPTEEEKKQLRIGIVATNYTWEDLNSYKEQFSEVQNKMGDKVKFILIGFDGLDILTNKSCFKEGFDFEYVKPSTIVHYFKQLRNLNLDLLFIPLRKNEFNITTENYNKFLEAGLFEVPIMVFDIFPYNEIVKNGNNGIIISSKKDFEERIEYFCSNKEELKRIGKGARKTIEDNFLCNEMNAKIIDSIFSFD